MPLLHSSDVYPKSKPKLCNYYYFIGIEQFGTIDATLKNGQ